MCAPGSEVYDDPRRFGIAIANHAPETWGFNASRDLAELALGTPDTFRVDMPDLVERTVRKVMIQCSVANELKDKQRAVFFDWRDEGVYEVLVDDDILKLNRELPQWSLGRSGSTPDAHYVRTWFGVHPLREEHVKFLEAAFPAPSSVRRAVSIGLALFPDNTSAGIRRFLAHLLARGVLLRQAAGTVAEPGWPSPAEPGRVEAPHAFS